MGPVVRKSDFLSCEQQRRRPACASTLSGQRLCYSLSGKNDLEDKVMNLELEIFCLMGLVHRFR